MKIALTSLMVDDQAKALAFYTNILGFEKKTDFPVGEFRWLTVTSPDGAPGIELTLEPLGFPPAKTYQEALYAAGISATAFLTDDIESEYQRLRKLGVVFRSEPKHTGTTIIAVFEDTCGNLISLVQLTT